MCVKIGAFWIALYSIIADEHAKTVPIVYTWIQNDFILFRINMENRLDETFPLMCNHDDDDTFRFSFWQHHHIEP